MSHIHRSAGAVMLTVALCLGMSIGPASADQPPPGQMTVQSTVTTPSTPTTQPTSTTTPPTNEKPTTTTVPAEPATNPEPAITPEPATTTTPDLPSTSSPTPTTQAPPATSTSDTPAENLPDLQLTVSFDKPAYFSYEEITAHATVTNAGTAPMDSVVLTSTGDLSNQSWWPLTSPGVRIEPGQTVESSTRGYGSTDIDDVLHLVVTAKSLADEQDANPADNTVSVTVPVTFVYGSYRGTVYADRNGNNAMDPGDIFSGLDVSISGGYQNIYRHAVTDAAGRFEFLELPAGDYSIWPNRPGWHFFTPPEASVDGVDDPDVLVRGVPLVKDVLSVSAAFSPPSYRLNDVARFTVTLVNKGDTLLYGLTALRIRTSDPNATVDLGELSGSGIAVPPGATRTATITITVTAEAVAAGYLRAQCTIGAPPIGNEVPEVTAMARILGGGTAPRVLGRFERFLYMWYQGPPVGEPLPGVKVYLRDRDTGTIVARAVTDSGGRFAFYNVPAGVYDFGFVGPWTLSGYSSGGFYVRAGEDGPEWYHLIFVIPGPDQPDPDAQPATGQPARPASGANGEPAEEAAEQAAGLAWTGANVTWLAMGAMVALAAGAGLIVYTRRNRWR